MSDASEVLYTLYEAINGVAGARSPVDAVFGLRVKEGVHCADCGASTHQQARARRGELSAAVPGRQCVGSRCSAR